jgi:signal transduction histidine kinase
VLDGAAFDGASVRRWSLARRVVALVGVVGLGVLASLVVLVMITTRNEAALGVLVTRDSPTRRLAGELATVLLEQQNAVRGYALSGNPTLRDAYRTAVDREGQLATELRAVLPPNDPSSSTELDRLLSDSAAWRAQAAEPLVASVATHGPRTVDPQTYPLVGQLFAPALENAYALVNQSDARRDATIRELSAFRRAELIALLAGGAVAVLAGTAALVLLRHWVTRPVARLATDARRVADGAHNHRVGIPSGPPELTAVAADVERMRSRIVSELAELATSQRELRETRDRLQSQAVDLMRSNRDLEQFAYVASHDLQEPLRKVSGFCQLLQRRYAGQLDERAQQYIEFAVDGAQRMQQLINALLAFSRVGRSEAALAEVSLADVVSEALAELDSTETADARIEVGELPRVYGDRGLLRQLMANLIGNALKFHRPDTAPEVRIEAARDELGWRISVTDNGIGIDPDFAEKIFVLFQRLHGRESYPGTGIGLALAKRIAEYHGGRIWLDTERRDGTTIYFTLPDPRPTPSQEPAS